MEHFKKRMLSNEAEQDDFFLPSDSVWNAVEDELDGKPKRRKPFILFFSSLIFIIAFFGILLPNSTRVKSFSNSNVSATEIGIQENSDASKAKLVSIVNPEKNQLYNSKTKSAISLRQPREKVFVSLLPLIDFSYEFHYKQHLTNRYFENINKARLNDLTEGIVNANLNDKRASLTGFGQNSAQNLIANLYEDWTIQNELGHKMKQNLMRDHIHVSDISKLNSNIHPALNYNQINPTFVEIEKASLIRDWYVGAHAYTSMSNYSISNYSGFEQIDFELKGKPSLGYQFIAEKNITRNISIYAGVGVDHAHFDANYLIDVDGSDLDFLTVDEQQNSARLSKTIPSLAGGLETTLVFSDISSNLLRANVDLSLAHDFKTITVPIGARFNLANSSNLRASFALGVEYSKRLLTIDTGVNSLNSDNGGVELSAVSPVENNSQPFTVNNVNATASISVDYQVTNRMSIGIQTGIVKPISKVYEDPNYTVNTYQIRGGLVMKYALKNDVEQ